MPERKLRVFLCHASQDKPVVRELYQRLLAEAWIDPWLDEEKLLPGQDWDMEIEKVLEDSDAVIVCLSSQSLTKEGYIQRELKFVLDIALEKPEEAIFVIPLRLENVTLPRRLRRWHYVDYFPKEHIDSSYKRLQHSLKSRFDERNRQEMVDANNILVKNNVHQEFEDYSLKGSRFHEDTVINVDPVVQDSSPNHSISSNLRQSVKGTNLEESFGGEVANFVKVVFDNESNGKTIGFQQPIDLSFEEAVLGTNRLIQLVDRNILVKIPAGVYTGSKVRLAGAIRKKNEAVDLYLAISVMPHPFIERTGFDLYMQYPILEILAVKGGKLQVPVLEKNKSVFILIPPNTKDKQVFRLTNKGIVNLKEPTKYGDFYVEVVVYDPLNTSPRVKKLLDDINSYVK